MDLELIIETIKYNQELADINLKNNDWSKKITDGINTIIKNEKEV